MAGLDSRVARLEQATQGAGHPCGCVYVTLLDRDGQRLGAPQPPTCIHGRPWVAAVADRPPARFTITFDTPDRDLGADADADADAE